MVYTFKNLRDQVLRIVDESGETTTDELVKELMNQAHQARCLERKWHFMLHPREVSFSTVAGQRTYTLHPEFMRPLYFYNATTNEYLVEVPYTQIAEQEDSLNSLASGTGTKYFAFMGETPFKAQPSSAAVVTVVSSSGSDTGASYQVVVKGENANGEVFAEILTLNGVGSVSTSSQFTYVSSITKSQSFNGTITVTCGGTTLLTLLPWEMGRSYRQIYLLNSPNTTETIKYRFYQQPLVLVNDYDIPDIPGALAQSLVWDTLTMLSTYLTNLPPTAFEMWKNMSMTWENNIHAHELAGQSIESQPKFFKDLRGE